MRSDVTAPPAERTLRLAGPVPPSGIPARSAASRRTTRTACS